jgi:diguanylate cyclase
LRTLGLALGFLCVASVLRQHDQPLVLWLLLGASSFLWPHVARSLAIRTDPARSERLHLTLDSALGGTAIALMQFNLLPSALLVTMLSMDKIAVGGIRFWLRTVAVLVAACILISATLGFAVDLETPTSVLVSCIPAPCHVPAASGL